MANPSKYGCVVDGEYYCARAGLTWLEKSGLIYYFEDEYQFVNPFFRKWVGQCTR